MTALSEVGTEGEAGIGALAGTLGADQDYMLPTIPGEEDFIILGTVGITHGIIPGTTLGTPGITLTTHGVEADLVATITALLHGVITTSSTTIRPIITITAHAQLEALARQAVKVPAVVANC